MTLEEEWEVLAVMVRLQGWNIWGHDCRREMERLFMKEGIVYVEDPEAPGYGRNIYRRAKRVAKMRRLIGSR